MNNQIFKLLLGIGFFVLLFAGCKSQEKLADPDQLDSESAYLAFYSEALKFQHTDQLDLAEENYRNAIHYKSNAADSYFGLFEVYFSKKLYDDAQQALLKAIEFMPQNPWYSEAKVNFYERLAMISELVVAAEELVNKFPANDSYQIKLAKAYIRSNQLPLANEVLVAIVPRITDREEVYALRLQVAKMQDDKPLIEKLIKELFLDYPSDVAYGGMLAEFYLNNKRYPEANETYNVLCKRFPQSISLRFSRASYYLLVDSVTQFSELFGSLVSDAKAPAQAKLNILLNLFLEYKGGVSQQSRETWLLEAVSLHPNHAQLVHFGIDTYLAHGNKSKATEVMELLIVNGTTDYGTFYKLIMLSIEDKDYAKANKYSDKALELYPNHAALYLLNALSLYELQQYEESINFLKNGKLLALDNKKLIEQFYYYLGEATNKLQRYNESDNYFEKVVEINVRNYLAMNNYAFYLSVRGQKLERAEVLAKACASANSVSYNYLDTYAWVLFKRKKYPQAEEVIKRALKYGGNTDATIVEHYGDILNKLDKKHDALLQWKISLKLNPNNTLLKQKIEKHEK